MSTESYKYAHSLIYNLPQALFSLLPTPAFDRNDNDVVEPLMALSSCRFIRAWKDAMATKTCWSLRCLRRWSHLCNSLGVGAKLVVEYLLSGLLMASARYFGLGLGLAACAGTLAYVPCQGHPTRDSRFPRSPRPSCGRSRQPRRCCKATTTSQTP